MTTNQEEEEEVLVIESPEQLTTVFAKLLQRQYPDAAFPQDCSVEITPLSQAAILSRVYQVTVCFHDSPPALKWIAKFLKSSLPLQDMFVVEGVFLQKLQRHSGGRCRCD